MQMYIIVDGEKVTLEEYEAYLKALELNPLFAESIY